MGGNGVFFRKKMWLNLDNFVNNGMKKLGSKIWDHQ